ncbi:MAG: hypothetical protein WC742_12505 [Gallionellaceae bacterium]|jgi:hypothetical protein
MDNKEIRRLNLLYLVKETGTDAKFSELTGMPEAYISQIRNRTPAGKKKTPRGVGNLTARKIEKAFFQPVGWMDKLIEEVAHYSNLPSENIHRITENQSISDDLKVINKFKADIFSAELESLKSEIKKVEAKIRDAAEQARIEKQEKSNQKPEAKANDSPLEERRTA